MNQQRRGILAALLYGPAALLGDPSKQPTTPSATIELPEGFKLEVRYCGKVVTLSGGEIMTALQAPHLGWGDVKRLGETP
jgi:hypothetical protein